MRSGRNASEYRDDHEARSGDRCSYAPEGHLPASDSPRHCTAGRSAAHHSRRWRYRLSLSALALGCVGAVIAGMLTLSSDREADAMVNGVSDSSTTAWSVRIAAEGPFSRCSGSLIAERWVLTAEHCVRRDDTGPVRNYQDFYLLLGASSIRDSRGVYRKLDQAPIIFNKYDVGNVMVNDVALLHLDAPAPASTSPLPLNPPQSVVPTGTPVTLTGWGPTAPDGKGVGNDQRSSPAGEWINTGACTSLRGAPRTVCYNRTKGALSFPLNGDSGGIASSIVKGGPVQLGIISGPGGSVASVEYGADVAQFASLIRSFTGLRQADPGTILREPSGAAYLVDDARFRHWIPDGGTYQCLTGNGGPVVNKSRFDVLSVPEDHTSRATCTSRPTPPAPTHPVFPVMNTSETLPDGVWFRDNPAISGPRLNGYGVYSGDRVELRCYGWGESIGRYANRLWYYSADITRPNAPGRANIGWLNAHFVNDGTVANQVVSGVPPC